MWPQIVLLFIASQEHGEQCQWGMYGEHCDKDCPLTCNTHPVRNLWHCQKYSGKCSEGCIPGHPFDQCDIPCSGGCLHKTCNQGNGQCTLGCSGTYRGDYCNVTSDTTKKGPTESNTANPTHLIAILVPVFTVFLFLVFLPVVLRRKCKLRRKPTTADSSAEALFLSEKQTEADVPYQMKDITKGETEIIQKVKEKLDIFLGAPGEGKTSMALMLGAEFRKQGYELVLVEEVGTEFQHKGKYVFVIFVDTLQKRGSSMDVHPVVRKCLKRWKKQQQPDAEQRSNKQENMYIIFTTEDKSHYKCETDDGMNALWGDFICGVVVGFFISICLSRIIT